MNEEGLPGGDRTALGRAVGDKLAVMRNVMHRGLVIGFLCCLWVVAACGDSEQEALAERQQIQATLEAYLPKLAEAYETGTSWPLYGLAAEKEMAVVEKWIKEVAAGGREIHATFHGLTIEDITRWGNANAYVTTLESWTVELYSGDGKHQFSSDERRDRVRYQLKREKEGWLILYRQRQEN